MDTVMRKAITAQERLLITLRYLATGQTYSDISILFRLPTTSTEWLNVSKEFEERSKFPHTIGAIDGKHIRIKAPSNSGTDFYNY
uniref:DDE Tnp4 domain-containing protein n=1 Tax=Anopheles dirus TaxID=7168 RepID=A0A182NGI9_9DIPT